MNPSCPKQRVVGDSEVVTTSGGRGQDEYTQLRGNNEKMGADAPISDREYDQPLR